MTPQQYLEHVAADSAHFASQAAGSLDHAVPALGWTARELVGHLGAVYAYVTANAKPGTEYTAAGDEGRAPEGDAINDWFAERRDVMLETLTHLGDEVTVWTHAGLQTGQWWKRRMACETAVHRWDLDAAINGVDGAEPIDGDLATIGVDEYLEVSLRISADRPERTYPAESLHLHRSDGPGEWMIVAADGGGVTVTHEHGKGDAAVRGPASDLFLWIWGRDVTGVEIFGDEAVANAWKSLAP